VRRSLRSQRLLEILVLSLILALAPACDQGDCLEGAFGGSCGDDPARDTAPADAVGEAGDDAVPAETIEPGQYPDDADADQIEALAEVNAVRRAVGLPPVDQIASLNQAATAHAKFYALHYDKYQSTGLSPHEEDPSFGEGFTAADFFARMQAKGFDGWGGFEIIAFYHNPRLAVAGWVATLYHRIPVVYPGSATMGYGGAGGGVRAIDVIDWGTGAPTPAGVTEVLYPWEGQTDVDVSWDGFESPQPPPPPGGYPSGPIVTATFVGAVPTVASHKLLDPSGAEVAHTFLTPTTDAYLDGTQTISLYADEPLEPLTTYRVALEGKRGTQPWTLEWSFTTAAH